MLLDTSGLLCLYDTGDTRHLDATTYFGAARQLLVTNYVIVEFVALANARGVRRTAALEFIIDLQNVPRTEVIWVDKDLHSQAFALLEGRSDKTYSLCDAASFVIMRERGITDALTTDHHFEQEGFVRLLMP